MCSECSLIFYLYVCLPPSLYKFLQHYCIIETALVQLQRFVAKNSNQFSNTFRTNAQWYYVRRFVIFFGSGKYNKITLNYENDLNNNELTFKFHLTSFNSDENSNLSVSKQTKKCQLQATGIFAGSQCHKVYTRLKLDRQSNTAKQLYKINNHINSVIYILINTHHFSNHINVSVNANAFCSIKVNEKKFINSYENHINSNIINANIFS